MISKNENDFFFDAIHFRLWDYVQNGQFVPTHHINTKVVNKSGKLWSTQTKKKVQQNFKVKYLMISVLRTR